MKIILVDAVNTLIVENNNGFSIFKQMQALLDSFDNQKIIITNANDEQFEKFNLKNLPYEVFTLKHNPDKTDPQYFKTLLDHFQLRAEDVVYFDHNPEAVKSAESNRITSHRYDPDKKDLLKLKNFLYKNLQSL